MSDGSRPLQRGTKTKPAFITEFQMTPKLPTEAWAIYNPNIEQWSRGGAGPKWGKRPKLWSTIGALKNHLNLMVYPRYKPGEPTQICIRSVYNGCYIYDVAAQARSDLRIDDILLSYVDRCYLSNHYYKNAEVNWI